LQYYIDLVESYEADTIEKLIIKEYAFTNSAAEIVRQFERRGITLNGKPIEKSEVIAVISGKAPDELHKILGF
jgi:hypothetical protein